MNATRKNTGPGRLLAAAVMSLLVLAGGCGGGSEENGVRAGLSVASRVISLSPSTTEIMFDLGLGGTLVGVSRFCQIPEGSRDIEDMGGYLDPNYEKIVSLKPDVVLLLPEQEGVGRYLSRLGLMTLTIDNKKVEDILAGITQLGGAFGREEAADSIVRSIGTRIEAVRRKSLGSGRKRVLVSIGHAFGSGKAQEVYAAGKGTYYDQLLVIAGGENVCDAGMVSFPVMSAEGMISLDPEVIIELIPVAGMEGIRDEEIVDEWGCLPSVSAVREGRIHVIRKEYSHIPGPRFILLLEEFAEILHGDGN